MEMLLVASQFFCSAVATCCLDRPNISIVVIKQIGRVVGEISNEVVPAVVEHVNICRVGARPHHAIQGIDLRIWRFFDGFQSEDRRRCRDAGRRC
jgi:hypothetical protein